MTAEFGLTAKEKLKMKVTDEMVNRFLAWKLDVYDIRVDGQPWKRGGLTAALEGLRKACPRVLSPRATY